MLSFSPANQVALAEEINKMARLLECQFIIATHSPFMLGTLNAKIYNIDSKEYDINYDLELIKQEYESVSKSIMEIQMALDKYNQTVQFEVDI